MNPAAAPITASDRGLRIFIAPRFVRRRVGWALIMALVLAISTVDYFVGVDYSLSVFYLLPISLTAGWFGRRAGIGVGICSSVLRLMGDALALHAVRLPVYLWWNTIAALAISLFAIWLVDSLVTAHHGLEGRIAARTSELADSIADRRRLELELLDVTARERAAIGRELHDELGQHLVATALAAQVLAQQLGKQPGGPEAHAIVRWIEQAIAKTRKLARGLLLAHIDCEHLISELEELAANASQGGVRCQVIHRGEKLTATAGQCAQLFRIAQEAIGNALRHARPRTIEILLAIDSDATCLVVSDDGAGFTQAQPTSGMGLRIMEHRAQIVGASVAVHSAPGEGTKVVCRLAHSARPPL
jgi:signal transduction histidine kinase